MWCYVDIVLTDVSEERIASIFRIEENLLAPAHAGSSLANIFSLYPEDGGDTFL
jgi:hypothetical protein